MNTSHRTRRAVLIAAGTLIALAVAVTWAWRRDARAADPTKADAKATPAVVVTTAAVQQRDVPLYRAGIGTVSAMQTVTVKARVDGQLDQVGFVEGQDVKAGQMLARIDPRTLQAQLAQAQATKAKDQATLANARVDLQRYTQLIAEDASTQQQVDTQKALVAQLEAAVKTDDAQIAYAQVQLGFTTIVAPISGRVGARLVDPGNIVHAADTTGLVVINQVDPISVVFTLPEESFQDVNRAINTHQPLAVQAYPRNGTDLLGTGKLTLLNNQIDTTNGTVQLKGAFANPTHTLWPGQYVNVRLVLGQRANALTIPAAAVQRGQSGTYVYAVGDDGKTVQTRPIEVAQIQDGIAIVDKGLSAGQKVVVDGQYKLKPGAAITEAARQGAAPASGAVLAENEAPVGAKK
jgi:membrane fusion protein, multidrug efflux system